jgi:hypothetical protein
LFISLPTKEVPTLKKMGWRLIWPRNIRPKLLVRNRDASVLFGTERDPREAVRTSLCREKHGSKESFNNVSNFVYFSCDEESDYRV